MTTADALKLYRNKKGWTQRHLADVSGVSNAEICRIEAGNRTGSSVQIICALADALDVNPFVLLSTYAFDDNTQEWLNAQAITDVKFSKCKKCGLLYKISLGHECNG